MSSLFEITTSYIHLGQLCHNVHHYFAKEGAGTAGEVIAGFSVEVLIPLINTQVTDVEWIGAEAKSLDNVNDVQAVAFNNVYGARSGESLASHNAFGVKLPNYSENVRAGGKRIGGVSEFAAQGNGAENQFFTDYMIPLLDALASTFEFGNDTFVPVIISPESATSWIISQIVTAVFNGITTQNSRKPYKGWGGRRFCWLRYDVVASVCGGQCFRW